MSFRFHAWGGRAGGGLHRARTISEQDCSWGTEWDLSSAITVAQSVLAPVTRGTVSAPSPTEMGTSIAAEAVWTMQFRRVVRNYIQLLQLGGGGRISVSTRDAGWIVNDLTYGEYDFSDRSATRVMKKMLTQMNDAGLNYMGPLTKMTDALNMVMQIPGDGEFLLNLSYRW